MGAQRIISSLGVSVHNFRDLLGFLSFLFHVSSSILGGVGCENSQPGISFLFLFLFVSCRFLSVFARRLSSDTKFVFRQSLHLHTIAKKEWVPGINITRVMSREERYHDGIFIFFSLYTQKRTKREARDINNMAGI